MWIPTKTKKYGVAIYNWRGDRKFGLPLEIGETVQILEESNGWYRGFSTKNRAVKGIFPQAYIHLKPCKVDNEGLLALRERHACGGSRRQGGNVGVEGEWSDIWKRLYACGNIPLTARFFVENPLYQPLDSSRICTVSWSDIWKRLYVERGNYKFETVGKVMRDLLEWRRQLVSGTLTHDQTKELKTMIIAKIDWGNRLYVERGNYKFETVGKVMRDLLEWRRQLVSGTLTHDQTKELKTMIIAKIDWGN
ncbi:Variant SH3 domain, partial [Popillia japonica]